MNPMLRAFIKAKITQLQYLEETKPSIPSPDDESDLPISACLLHKLHGLADIFERAKKAHEKSFTLRPRKRSLDLTCHDEFSANAVRQRTGDAPSLNMRACAWKWWDYCLEQHKKTMIVILEQLSMKFIYVFNRTDSSRTSHPISASVWFFSLAFRQRLYGMFLLSRVICNAVLYKYHG